jgi:hypothetical protein
VPELVETVATAEQINLCRRAYPGGLKLSKEATLIPPE